MALHELATNAIKYGAFSNETGTVTITWSLAGAESGRRFHIGWVEEGGPQVVEPNRRGFGRTVLERVSAEAVNGGVTLTYDPGGVRWQLNAPADQSLVR